MPCVPCEPADVAGGTFQPGQVVDLYDADPTQSKWVTGSIVEVTPEQVKVHFKVCFSSCLVSFLC